MSPTTLFIYPVQLRIVNDESLSGAIDDSNVMFSTNYVFIPGTITVYLNGLRLRPGINNDYIELDDQTIEMNYAPLVGDVVMADYLRKQ